MIQFPGFVFYSVPRTGSTWVMKAASHVGLKESSKAEVHIPPAPGSIPLRSISTVRAPWSWLDSYFWTFRGGSVGVPEIDCLASIAKQAESSEEFIRTYLETVPGSLTDIFRRYSATSIIRLEDFPFSPISAFQSYGVRMSSEQVRDLESWRPVNSRKRRGPALDRGLIRDLIKSEEEFCESYEYWY